MDAEFMAGPWLVAPKLNRLTCDGRTARLEPKVMQVLVCLAEHAGEVVSKEQLIQAVWADTFVTDDVLKRCISDLRKAVGEDRSAPTFIETIPKGGYRLIAPVTPVEPASEPAPQDENASASDSEDRAASPKPDGVHRRRLSRRTTAILVAGALVIVIAAVIAGLMLREQAQVTPIRSLAVLPLENLSHDPEQDYFADGMTETLITTLSRISALRLLSRTSVMQYKGVKKPVSEIAHELKVDAIIEGSVIRDGNRVRITAQLIAMNPERHVWANSYDRDLRDVLLLHSQVARSIAQEIRVKLTPEEQTYLAAAQPVSPAAHEAYLRGRFHSTRFTPDSLLRARQYLEQAIALDPNYTPAYADLAHVYIKLSSFASRSVAERLGFLAQAKATAQRAVQLDPNQAEAHMYLAMTTIFLDWDYASAWHRAQHAMELAPNSADVLLHGAWFLLASHRDQDARAALERALELDPLNYEISSLATAMFQTMRDYPRALQQAQKTVELDPNAEKAYARLGDIYQRMQMYPQALTAYENEITLAGALKGEFTRLRNSFQREGVRAMQSWRLARLQRATAAGEPTASDIAGMYAENGSRDAAFTWLEKAYEQRDPGLFSLGIRHNFDPLRSDPRFVALVKKIGIPE